MGWFSNSLIFFPKTIVILFFLFKCSTWPKAQKHTPTNKFGQRNSYCIWIKKKTIKTRILGLEQEKKEQGDEKDKSSINSLGY